MTLEAPVANVQQWLQSPELPQKLANLHLPASTTITDKKMNYSTGPPELAAEGTLEAQCLEAFKTVKGFEASHAFDAASLSPDYLSSRTQAVETAFRLAQSLQLGEEVAFDAVLLMDRVVSTGLTPDDGLMDLLVTACLRVSFLHEETALLKVAEPFPNTALSVVVSGAGWSTPKQGAMVPAPRVKNVCKWLPPIWSVEERSGILIILLSNPAVLSCTGHCDANGEQ